MKKGKVSLNKIMHYITAFCVPVIGLLVIYAICDMMPFGTKSILTGDCEIQYASFLNYMGEILRGNVSPLYTFSKTLGGDLSSFLSYYCLSPFNTVLLLFDSAHMQEAVLLLIALKTGLAGSSMYALLSSRKTMAWQTIIFSTAYALMGYSSAYQHNLMWLDGLVFLPIVVMGLEALLQSGSRKRHRNLYCIMLALVLLTNYYIGYMLCIFAVLYTMYYLFFDDEMRRESWQNKKRSLVEFAKHSLLAGGLAAISLVPTALSLRGGKAAFDIRDLLDFTVLYTPAQVIKELFIGNYAVKGEIHTLPNIYCGIFVLILLMTYFAASKYSRREKIGNAGLLAIFLISFLISAFDRVWHGTTTPAGSPHRYSFLLSFCLILIAYKGYAALRENKLSGKQIIAGIAGYGVLFAVYLFARRKADIYLVMNMIGSVLLLAAIYGEYRLKEKPQKEIMRILMVGVICMELVVSGCVTLRAYERKEWDSFTASVEASEQYVNDIKEQDGGWYRMEQYGTNVTMNDAMLYQYNGLWSYSSCEKEVTKRLAGKLGLNDRAWWITYHNEMPLASESLLGLKYIISTEKGYEQQYKVLKEYQQEGVRVYQNPYALPLGILADKELMNVHVETWDVLALQNDIWKRMTGEKEEIYRLVNQEETAGDEHYLEYTLRIEEELPVYTAFRNYGTIEEMIIYVNGTEHRRVTPEMQTYRLGTFREGDIVTVALSGEQTDISWYDIYFYYEDAQILHKYSRKLQAEGMQLTDFSQDRFRGTVYNAGTGQKLLALTIPADKGWTVLVDGVLQKPVKVIDNFMGITIEEGSHQIELYYIPQGLWQGAGISMAAICIMIIRSILQKQKEEEHGI